MQEVEFGEKLECEGSVVCGMDTGRVIAKFSHEAEAESFVDAYNSQSELSDLEIVQKALAEICGQMVVLDDGSCEILRFDHDGVGTYVYRGQLFGMLTWAKQTIGIES